MGRGGGRQGEPLALGAVYLAIARLPGVTCPEVYVKRAGLIFLMLWLVGCSALPQGAGRADYHETGQASYYADHHQNQLTANGERYSHDTLTAAHKTLPFNTLVKVTNLDNGKSVVVRINDRGPFVRGRVIDLSKSAFTRIGELRTGLLRVALEVERPAPGR